MRLLAKVCRYARAVVSSSMPCAPAMAPTATAYVLLGKSGISQGDAASRNALPCASAHVPFATGCGGERQCNDIP